MTRRHAPLLFILPVALAFGCGATDAMETGEEHSDHGDMSETGHDGSTDETTGGGSTDETTGDGTTGDGDGDGDGDGTDLEVIGDYTDEWMTDHTITNDTWTQAGDTYAIASFDNDTDFLVAQNGSMNAFNPDLWSRFDWVWVGMDLYYCQSSFDSATEMDAAAVERPVDTDPATGCGGMFAWTLMTP